MQTGLSRPFRPIDRDEIVALTGAPGFLGGVLMAEAATVHPGRLVRGLRRMALGSGVRVFENSAMVQLDRGSPPVARTIASAAIAALL